MFSEDGWRGYYRDRSDQHRSWTITCVHVTGIIVIFSPPKVIFVSQILIVTSPSILPKRVPTLIPTQL